jgi:hypothetical protein
LATSFPEVTRGKIKAANKPKMMTTASSSIKENAARTCAGNFMKQSTGLRLASIGCKSLSHTA